MAVGSGLGSSLGVAAESVYGTYVAPTRFVEFSKEDFKKIKNTIQGGGLAAGRLVQLGSRRVVTDEAAEGSLELDVPNKGFGLLLQHVMGATATVVQQGGTPAYLQTHTFADNVGKSLSIQKGVPDTGGVVRPFTFRGGKVKALELSCAKGGHLMSKIDFDFQRASEVEVLAAPSMPIGMSNWSFAQMAVKIGAFGAEASVSGIKKFQLNIERGMNTERIYAGGLGFKEEPIMNAFAKITGSIESDFKDKTILADRFASDANFSMIWEFTGPVISGAFNYLFRVKLPMTFLDGDTPGVDGPDIINGTFPFVVQSDGTNQICTIEYQSIDTAV